MEVSKKERRRMSKDISEKRLEEYEDVFADIFNNLVASGKKIVEEDLVMTMLPMRIRFKRS